ncbi:polyamine aminopropyltransferase [Clostridium sp.]|uniref:polyamine aminopropyltransferase n=1 Tax=Clostridium sp. TaxID=1506 RepID=UPI0025BC0370|nr:polyamine aminopropyltransferase [Clostridium sp.]
MEESKFRYKLLMITTLIISGCSIIYEVLISSVSSYLIGDSIKQFSITIGIYMSAMGIGSYISKFIKKNLFDWFVLVEISVGFIGGLSSLILFLSNVYLESYQLIMYIQIILIGILVGLEIPLLTRIIEENTKNLRITLSSIFSFDYIGGLIGSIAFPLILLPNLGYFATSFLIGSLNIIISLIIIFNYKKYIRKSNAFKIIAFLALSLMVLGTIFSENIALNVENRLYRDKIILNKQTKYQKIVVTKHKDDLRLYINGNIQFSTIDEYRYHESLVHIPMSVSEDKSKVLILGGGDGLAVREVLKYEEVDKITLVDLDKEMVELSQNNKEIRKVNNDSLNSDKLKIVYEDAFEYLENSNELFNIILVDLPDPNDENLNKLYTNIFYRLVSNRLDKDGVISIQSTSPYYAKEAFWCINKTLEEEGLNVIPYHVEVPSFGDWGFQLASKKVIEKEKIKINVETKFLNNESIDRLFMFSEDEIVDKDKLITNTIARPQLINYYLKAIENWR